MRPAALVIALCLCCFEARAHGVQASAKSSGPTGNSGATHATALQLPTAKAQPVILPRFDQAPLIDGKLDEDVWKTPAVLGDFTRLDQETISLSSSLRGQFLFDWTPNPGTALYAGYNDALNYSGFAPFTNHFEREFTGMAGRFLSRLLICSGEAFDQPLHTSQEGESNENQTINGALYFGIVRS